MPPAAVSVRGLTARRPGASPVTLALAVVFVAGTAAVAVATRNGLANGAALGVVDLANTFFWLAAARRWSVAGDAETRRFWRFTALAAVAVAVYCFTGGLASLMGVSWLGGLAAVSALSALPLILAGIASRPRRAQGRNAGWSTVLDVGIVVLSVGGPFAPFLIAPAWGSHDLRIVTLSGIWLALLFLVGAFLLAAYRTPVGRSPAGLLLMSLMAV
ncbi:MAG TPA: hypothetical protein VEU76_09315, partial [Candidatus Udaeobacter sp.]|nr:hypothetical protein [Candidatus Udaeobacter sp.]